MSNPISVGFLMLDDIHHLHHLTPVAAELSKYPGYECTVYIQRHSHALLNSILNEIPQQRCRIRIAAPSRLKQIKYGLHRKTCNSAQVIRHHLPELSHYDAIVSADFDLDLLIQTCQTLSKKPLFFAIAHGAGDRDFKYFSSMSTLDCMLLSGQKYLHRFINAGYLKTVNHPIVGYPKFDLIPVDTRPQLFTDSKPVVLYNPHFLLDTSSWTRWGNEVLEYFYQQKTYNFIFAPHRNLFKRVLKARQIPKKYFNANHLIIDLDSHKSVDMTYTQAADVYLGDVSSQVYEFIRRPRPCFFLNAHGIDWQNDPYYLAWQMGAVVEDLNDFWKALENAPLTNPYTAVQEQLFHQTFSITAEPASARAACAINQRMTSAHA